MRLSRAATAGVLGRTPPSRRWIHSRAGAGQPLGRWAGRAFSLPAVKAVQGRLRPSRLSQQDRAGRGIPVEMMASHASERGQGTGHNPGDFGLIRSLVCLCFSLVHRHAGSDTFWKGSPPLPLQPEGNGDRLARNDKQTESDGGGGSADTLSSNRLLLRHPD